MIYLDTHVVLWLYLRKGEGLSGRARQLIEYEPVILISPMILLELDYLHEIGRTTLGHRMYSTIFINELTCRYAKNLLLM